MRALVTGGYGFVGKYLSKHLVECGDDVAVTYNPSKAKTVGSEIEFYPELPKTIQSFALDVTDTKAVSDVISLAKPDVVYHLAAHTFVPDGEESGREFFEVNTFGTGNFLSAIVEHSKDTRFLYVSSSEVYGTPRPGQLPLTENSELRPVSTYGVSKASADLLVHKFAEREGIYGIRVRPFPHIGPGQSSRFAISSFARQLAEIKISKSPGTIKVGNIEVRRDYSDVNDIVRGYREAGLNGKRGEAYNLSSGKSVEIAEALNRLIDISGVEVEVEVDPERVRETDIVDVYGSYEKASKEFGWQPRIDLDSTLKSLYSHWLEVLS